MGCCNSTADRPQIAPSHACTLCRAAIPLGEARRHICGHRFHRTCLLALALGEAICPDCGAPVQLTVRSRRAQAKAALLKPLDPALMPKPIEINDLGEASVERYEGCVVCQEDLSGNSLVRLPCSHVLHGECADEWLQHKRECPLCRSPAHPTRLPPSDQVLVDRLQELAEQQRARNGVNGEPEAAIGGGQAPGTVTPGQLTPGVVTPAVSPAVTPRGVPPTALTSASRFG